ncbi:class I SAM-dependent methyltransferase [soil metagenome]
MTTLTPASAPRLVVDTGVYAPQHDSYLLIETANRLDLTGRATAVDVCTGSGVVAIALARAGIHQVTAWDVCPRAVRCARANAAAAGVTVDVRLGSFTQVKSEGPCDLVVSNPPYVPTPRHEHGKAMVAPEGPSWAWNAGEDGRLILDPLCHIAAGLLAPGGTFLLAQSEFSGIDQTLTALRASGLVADVAASQHISFGPVLMARASWLERRGKLEPGRREEELVIIRADKP